MHFNQFISANQQVLTKFYKRIYNTGYIADSGGKLLYPNIALYTETKDFYVVEVFGASERFTDLKVKNHKVSSLEEYIYQFNYQPKGRRANTIPKDPNLITLMNLYFGGTIGDSSFKERFTFLNNWPTKLINPNENPHHVDFGPYANMIFLINCVFVNRQNETFRVKPIRWACICFKGLEKHKYKRELISKLSPNIRTSEDLHGVLHVTNEDNQEMSLYQEFLNLYQFRKLRETTLGDYLNQNNRILLKFFQSDHLLYEVSLKWIEGNPDPEEQFIRPDFLIKRPDGFYDILDLKLPYQDRERLTRGPRKRRNFMSIVEDGLAQLANYADYFSYAKNQEYALVKYGIKVSEPKLIVIIGSYYNYNKDEIYEASRKLDSKFMILDYDTLNLGFLHQEESENN